MAETTPFLANKRYAVVTGGNKGVGLEVCRQLASEGVVVVLTSRDEKRGLQALENLKHSGIKSDNLEFYQFDVTDPQSAVSLADFIKTKFGKLDILVNNAGIPGANVDFEALIASGFIEKELKVEPNSADHMLTQTYELAEQCFKTNYYGVKTTTQALLPLLQLSDSPRIVNVASGAGKLDNIPNEEIRAKLSNAETLTEKNVEAFLNDFLRDFKDGTFLEKGWPPVMSAYFASKAAVNAYTRILANNYSSIIINSVCPGFVKSDFNMSTGDIPLEEGASRVVRLSLLPHGSSSGLFYMHNQVTPF